MTHLKKTVTTVIYSLNYAFGSRYTTFPTLRCFKLRARTFAAHYIPPNRTDFAKVRHHSRNIERFCHWLVFSNVVMTTAKLLEIAGNSIAVSISLSLPLV